MVKLVDSTNLSKNTKMENFNDIQQLYKISLNKGTKFAIKRVLCNEL